MSRAKLFNMIKSRGETPQGRNTFDLSNSHVYTSKVGKITPIKCIHTYPYDYLDVNLAEFSQNNIPLNTAAFLKGKKELLAYFVPYNTIWHNFNQFQATREDPDSTLLKERGITYEPRIKLEVLYNSALYFMAVAWFYKEYPRLHALYTAWQLHKGFDDSSDPTEYTLVEYMNYLNSIDYKDNPRSTDIDVVPTLYEYYINSFRKVFDTITFDGDKTFLGLAFECFDNYVLHKELSFPDTARNFNGNFIWCDWCQKMDMLGYGNIYPILKNTWDSMTTYLDSILDESAVVSSGVKITYSKFGYDAEVGDHAHDSFADIVIYKSDADSITSCFDSFLSSAKSRISSMTTYVVNGDIKYKFVNPYSFYAYNKCFYDYMRNVYFDNDYYVYNYNCDFINGNTLEGSIIGATMLPLRWYHLECHQWKKDMFTGVLPDNQLGQVSSLVLNTAGSSVIEGRVDVEDVQTGSAIYSQDSVTKVLANTSVSFPAGSRFQAIGSFPGASDSTLGFDDEKTTNSIHSAAVIQTPHKHLLSQTGFLNFTGSGDIGNVELNVLALKRAEAIQQYRQDLMRAGNRTKDVFKQVYGVEPKSELDECPYFIEVASNDININPIVSTASTGQDNNGKLGDIAARALINPEKSLNFKFSTKDFGCLILLSYVVPESMYNSYRIDPMNTHLDQEAHGLPYFQNLGLQPIIGEYLSNLGGNDVQSRVLGYAPPYLEFKTDIDLVHGNLVDCMLPALSENDVDTDYQGSMSHWVVARTDMQQEQAVSLRNFYINPRILDNVFQFNAGDDYETDHFLNFAQIIVKASRAFSEIGLPHF